MIEYDNFQKALSLLQEQNNRRNSMSARHEQWVIDAVKESVIQRFETCWDCLWKVLRRYLKEEIGLSEVPNGPNPVLRLANENRLLPGSIDKWLAYGRARIATSHDYSGEKANDVLDVMDDFIGDAVGLYQILSGKRWE